MRQRTVTPADLSGAPLNDLKQWLGVTRPDEDQTLLELLHAALQHCQSFTGIIPLEATLEETHRQEGGCINIVASPVQSIVSVHSIDADGTASALADQSFALELDVERQAKIQLDNVKIAKVRFIAGYASSWPELPNSLRHGIIRLAAHFYQERGEVDAIPPLSVAALWQPWRMMRLS